MAPTPDELAGAVDLFGGLTRDELAGAFEDLAARSGEPYDPDGFDDLIDDAVESYYLVSIPVEGSADLLVAGPAALPSLPEGGDDLPHLVDVDPDERAVDPDRIARTVEERLRADAARAVDAGDRERAERLLDVCYDVDTWAPADTADVRERLADFLDR